MSSRLFFLAIFAVGMLAMPFLSKAAEYRYMTAEELKGRLDTGEALHLVDIQVEAEFAAHHIPGAISTCAYPVKTEDEKGKLAGVLADLQKDEAPVVIVCPRGAGGAQRAFDFLKERGIAENRLYILEKGQEGWPYQNE